MHRRTFEGGIDVDFVNDSEELERLYVGEDGGDIGAAESFSRRHPWEHGSLFSFRTPNLSNVIPFVTWRLNDPDFDDAAGFTDDDF